jgi:hypothetical protein
MSLRFAPGAKIHRVQSDAEDVCRDETELRRPESDYTDDDAIDRRQNPAFPATLL